MARHHELPSRSRQAETPRTFSEESSREGLAVSLRSAAKARLEIHVTRTSSKMARSVILLATIGLTSPAARAQDVADDGRVGIVLAHPIFDALSGVPYFWFDGQTGDVTSFRVAFPNVIYHARSWLQGWGGLLVTWTDKASGDTRELRPYVGVKIFVPNSAHIHLFDWTRLEWRRTTNTDDDTVTRVWRLRTRPGVEFPLSANAWKPGSFYGLANTELFVEHDFVDAVRFMSGAGYIRNDRLRIELQYVLELSRKSATDALAYSDNSFRLDFKFSLREGLLHSQQGPE